jgi:hypothetical protein
LVPENLPPSDFNRIIEEEEQKAKDAQLPGKLPKDLREKRDYKAIY